MTFAGIASAVAALRLGSLPAFTDTLVPFSAGLLLGITGFGVLPELAARFGFLCAMAWLAAGVVLLWTINRYVYAVCPDCAHSHTHEQCAVRLHGFAPPLVAAAVLHSFLDGWSLAASEIQSQPLGITVFLGVLLHKLPEGLAYGSILLSALGSRRHAFAWSVVTQLPTVIGGLTAALPGPNDGAEWIAYALALAGGSFLFLGWHAVKSDWKRRGARIAFSSALSGAAGAAALHHGLRLWLRSS
ncbi:MAG: ZIP family metal transporter [Bryobacterales bacterium]|nr:ZIP family metal transporter [Bryobacteraceae bacterium]MDW8353365.1 ZIP family metal transporter [Bryobacterales bacterium]